jgi:hypothetical protein
VRPAACPVMPTPVVWVDHPSRRWRFVGLGEILRVAAVS